MTFISPKENTVRSKKGDDWNKDYPDSSGNLVEVQLYPQVIINDASQVELVYPYIMKRINNVL
jgi:hypothetical protein